MGEARHQSRTSFQGRESLRLLNEGGTSVVVPTRDRAPLLADLLKSLETQTVRHEVVVVDNGSTDGTAAMVAERFPRVKLVRLAENVGFGKAVNCGVEASGGRTLVLLNNDVVCRQDFVERLCAMLAPDEGVAMVAGVLVQADDPSLIDTAGIELDPTLLGFDYLRGAPLSVLEGDVPDPLGPCAGAAGFMREAFESVGGFDENIFAYLEDVDLVVRMLKIGARCRLARDAVALHRHSATLGAGSHAKSELISWSRGYIIGKYRLHRRRPLFARTLVEELLGIAGRLVIDRRNLGVTARIRGFRAGCKVDGAELPSFPRQVRDITLVDAQRRRIARHGRRQNKRFPAPIQ